MAIAHHSLPATQVWVTCSRPATYTRCEAGSKQGCSSHSSRRTAHRSAALPGKQRSDSVIQPERLRAAKCGCTQVLHGHPAPRRCGWRPWPGGPHGAFHETGRGGCSKLHRRCPGRNSGRAPDWPKCGGIPLASFRFEVGQCATWQPSWASRSISPASDVRHARRSAAARAGPGGAAARSAARRAFQAFLDFVRVSCTCMWIGISSWAARVAIFSKVLSATV
jgi:hypothetical protein